MKPHRSRSRCVASLLLALFWASPAVFAADTPALIGNWALTIPGGGAGWLGVSGPAGTPQAAILWGGGSVLPVDRVELNGGQLVLTRVHVAKEKNAAGQEVETRSIETIRATVSGDDLKLTTQTVGPDGQAGAAADFRGRRIPPVPAAPDLAKVRFGSPVVLFNGRDLTGWKLTEARAVNGWSAKDGLLINLPMQASGQPHLSYGNLRTEQEFEDFNLTLETRPTEGSNSGVYLRGIYEVQVIDSYGKPRDSHFMGAVYSRITPSVSAEKPTGEWETLDITLVDRHVTVILNGRKIIDNQPVLGCTGGALWSDEFRPGPIYLQGDHAQIEYRNIVLRPVVK